MIYRGFRTWSEVVNSEKPKDDGSLDCLDLEEITKQLKEINKSITQQGTQSLVMFSEKLDLINHGVQKINNTLNEYNCLKIQEIQLLKEQTKNEELNSLIDSDLDPVTAIEQIKLITKKYQFS